MHKKTKIKYLRDIKRRVGRDLAFKHLYCSAATGIIISYAVSFLPKSKIKYCEKKVVFHEHGKIEDYEYSEAACLNVKTCAGDFFICFDSQFRKQPLNMRLVHIAHELGHVFSGSDPNKSIELNEAAADEFLDKHYLDNKRFSLL